MQKVNSISPPSKAFRRAETCFLVSARCTNADAFVQDSLKNIQSNLGTRLFKHLNLDRV